MVEFQYELIQPILAFITLLLGGALIIIIYDAYRIVKQKTLLFFTVGLFILVVGIVVPDVIIIADPSAISAYWASVVSRILEIVGIGVMIFSILRG